MAEVLPQAMLTGMESMLAVAVVREGIILSMSRLQKIDCRRLLTLASWLVLRTILQEFPIARKFLP